MAIVAVTELAFCPTEHHFTINGVLSTATKFYVQYSRHPDMTDPHGSSAYGISVSALVHFTHLVNVDPNVATAGDKVYWRLAKWNATNNAFNDYGNTHEVLMRRSRSDQSGWSFVVAPNMRGTTGNTARDSRKHCVPTAISLNPDFWVCPGNLATVSADVDWNTVRSNLDTYGLTKPIYITVGRYDNASSFRDERLAAFPCADLFTDGRQVIRSPYNDVQYYERITAGVNETGSYYSFPHGNALFIVLNDWYNREPGLSANIPTTYEQEWLESVLKEHRHKYKWCFMFSSTSVDATATSGSIASSSILQSWLMGLHSTYKVTAHFSGEYTGWRCKKHDNGTLYVNATFGAALTDTTNNSEWHLEMAFANVRIGVDGNGQTDENYCRVDIVHSGFDDGSGHQQGQIINTSTSDSGLCEAFVGSINDHNGDDQPTFDSNTKNVVIPMHSDNWIYSDQSNPSTTLIDHVLSEKFYETTYRTDILASDMSELQQSLAWKVGSAPFISPSGISSSWTDNYAAHNVTNGGASAISSCEIEPRTVLASNGPSPCYFVKLFDIGDNIQVDELQMIYELDDAAFVWINGNLAWHSDGEGMPTLTGPPFASSQRPAVDPNWLDVDSDDYAQTITDLEPDAPSGDSVVSAASSHQRLPKIHYETSGQPIRIINTTVINSLKAKNNIIAILLLQGRDSSSDAAMISSDAAMDIELVAFGKNNKHLFSPRITSPNAANNFNNGIVNIAWNKNTIPSSNDLITTDSVTYEIEYTDNYQGRDTNWYSLKNRIPWSDESFEWRVGKMIKSNSVRVRIRARTTIDEQSSDWSMSNTFAINVFTLMAPTIVHPLSNTLYADYIMIILDESLTKNTYHQKVRYTLEYYSQKQNIGWTVIAADLPVGHNVVRWSLEGVGTSDDYVLRLTCKNTSTCTEPADDVPDQMAMSFVYNIRIQQTGMFIIDTKPPQTILEIEGNAIITNQTEQIINVFASDETTQVEHIQIRECDAGSILSLGDLSSSNENLLACPPITELISENTDFTRLIGKPVNNKAKMQWTFDGSKSGLRKLEALLTDTGGNSSIQESAKIFVSTFSNTDQINDYLITIEQRDKVSIQQGDGTSPVVTVEPGIFEVVYLGTSSGQLWVLEPFARLVYTLPNSTQIKKVVDYSGLILLLAYNENQNTGYAYRHDNTKYTLLHTFSDSTSIAASSAIFNDDLYVGLENGQLWKYDGFSFVEITTGSSQPISSLAADSKYLYIGLANSDTIFLYNGTSFFNASLN